MPKLEKKVLTATLYTYVRPINNQWVRKEAKKKAVSYSEFIDAMIARARRRKTSTPRRAKAA